METDIQELNPLANIYNSAVCNRIASTIIQLIWHRLQQESTKKCTASVVN